jgi:uncharacterized protein YjcR
MVDRLNFDEIIRVQNLMASRIASEDEVNSKLAMIDIITQLTGKKKHVQVEEVILEAKYQNVSEDETLRILDELDRDYVIVMVDGRIKMNY